MTDSGYTHIAVLLDRSGSMVSIKKATEDGFEAFVAEQRDGSGRCTMTLAQFDNEYEAVFGPTDIDAVRPVELTPRGATALLDSIGHLIHATRAFLVGLREEKRPGLVIVGIITDGMENASTEYTHEMVKALIEKCERDWGWTFLYMGANQDAIEVGTSLGVAADRSLTFGTGSVEAGMEATSANIGALRRSVAAGVSPSVARQSAGYTSAQRGSAAGGVGRVAD